MHSDCELLVVCKIRHNHVYSSQSSFDELFNMIAYEDFTLLVNCINTTVTAEQSLHHNIILEKQDHCTVSRVNTKTAISRSHTSVQTSTEQERNCFCWSVRPTMLNSFFSFRRSRYRKIGRNCFCWSVRPTMLSEV